VATEEVTTKLNIDITQFKKALTDANRYIRLASSEFDKASAGVENFANDADTLRAKLKQLSTVQEAQKAKVAALRLEYDRVAQEQGESSKAAQEMAIKLNKAEAAVEKTGKEMSQYKARLNEVEKGTNETEKETKQLDAAMSRLDAVTSKVSGGFTVMKGVLANLVADGIRAAIEGFKDLLRGGYDFYTAMEGYTTSFEVMTGSAEKAAQVTEKLGEIAARTPFELNDLADTTQLLMNYGFTADDALVKMTMLGDVAQGNADKMNRIATAYGQMSSAGKVSLEDVKQMIEAGFNPLQEISQTTGESMASLYKRISKGKLSIDEITASMQRSTSEGGKYFQSMEKQSQTLSGRLSSLKDAINSGLGTAMSQVLGNIADNLLPNLTSKLDGIDWEGIGARVNKMADPLIKLFSGKLSVGDFFQTIADSAANAIPKLASGVTQMVQSIIKAAPQMLAAGSSMVSSLVGAIRTNLPQLLQAGGEMLHQLLSGVVSNLPAMAQGAMNAIDGFVQGFQTYLPIIISKGAELLGKLGEGIQTGLPGLVSQGLDILMNFATTLYDNAPALIDAGIGFISNLVQGILDSIPALLEKAPEIVSKFANIINDNIPKLLVGGVKLVWQIIKGIISAIPDLIAAIPSIIAAIVDVWSAFNWLNLGKTAITKLKDGVKAMVGAVKTAGTNVATSLTTALQSLPGKLLNLGKSAITFLRNGISSMVGALRTAGGNILTAIVSSIQALPGKLLAFGQQAITSLGNAIQVGVTTAKSKATAIVNGIVNAFQSLPSKMVQIGKNVIQGVINGIGSMVGALYDSIHSALSGLVDKAKGALGINSPSRVFRDIVGKMIPAGIAEGIVKNTKAATKAMVKSTKGIVSAANAELSGSTIGGPTVNTDAPSASGRRGGTGATYVFNQYNNSPKALSRKDIYRQTKNALKFATSNA
jgi:tape measure domain-containing protein